MDTRKKEKIYFPKIADCEETLEQIINNQCSLCRFGDGEFALISGNLRAKFTQKYYPDLAQKLIEVLHSDEKNILIGIADNYGNLEKYSESTIREIRHYMTPQIRSQHMNLLQPNRIYHNAYITRPYIIYADTETEEPARRFAALKKIWDHKNVIIIEGDKTRMGVGNDLLQNAASVKRIIAPAVDAFEKYNDILQCAMNQGRNFLFLIALGPVATVMAYDLAKAGYWAIDIGHTDIEYEWFLKGTGKRECIPTKFNNEYPDGEKVQQINDVIYNSQIIADFS